MKQKPDSQKQRTDLCLRVRVVREVCIRSLELAGANDREWINNKVIPYSMGTIVNIL